MSAYRQINVQTTFIECLVTAVCPTRKKKLCYGYITRGLPYFLSSRRCAILDISIQVAVCHHLRPVRQSQASHTTSCVHRLLPDVCQNVSNYEAELHFLNSSIASFAIAPSILDLCVPFGARDFHTHLKNSKIIFVVNMSNLKRKQSDYTEKSNQP